MRGEVLEFDAATGGGVIGDEYGARYTFEGSAVRTPLSVGDRVDFNAVNGVASDIQRVNTQPFAEPDATAWNQAPIPPQAPVPNAPYDFQAAMFSFNGRLRRSHYWITWAITFGAGIIASFIPFVGIFVSLALIWPVLAKDVKRLHDMGQSGWWAAIPFGVGLIGGIAVFVQIGMAAMNNMAAFEREDPEVIMALIGPAMGILALICLVQLAFWLWFGIQDSQKGANAFGPNPKGE